MYLSAFLLLMGCLVFSVVSALAPDSSLDKKRPIIFFQGEYETILLDINMSSLSSAHIVVDFSLILLICLILRVVY